jgi:hypothetical protein
MRCQTKLVHAQQIDFKTKLENLVKQCIPFKKLNTKIKTPWISMTQRKEINSIKQ